ncbi:sensor histidine kinase [Undibacterium arcticum]
MQTELALRQTDQDEIHRSLEQLSKSSESATHLVNQLLTLARAENQTPASKPFEPLELSALARDIVHDWVQASFARRIDLGFEAAPEPVELFGNPVMLRELLSNLIDNALRYTPAQGSVTVRVRSDGDGEYAILEVEDTGPGIPPSERHHVFERFYRILGSNVSGSGLGLSIVREIAQQHAALVDIFLPIRAVMNRNSPAACSGSVSAARRVPVRQPRESMKNENTPTYIKLFRIFFNGQFINTPVKFLFLE